MIFRDAGFGARDFISPYVIFLRMLLKGINTE